MKRLWGCRHSLHTREPTSSAGRPLPAARRPHGVVAFPLLEIRGTRSVPRSQSQSRPVVACSRTAGRALGQGQQRRRRRPSGLFTLFGCRRRARASTSRPLAPCPGYYILLVVRLCHAKIIFLDCCMVLGCSAHASSTCWSVLTCRSDANMQYTAWSNIGGAHNCITETTRDMQEDGLTAKLVVKKTCLSSTDPLTCDQLTIQTIASTSTPGR